MESKTPTPDTRISARRRLLRGSFSVPAVLTLASGSALAENSATCLAKATSFETGGQETAPLATGTPTATDTFLRVRLVAYTEGTTTKHAVTKASFGAIDVDPSFWTSDIAWQEFDVSGNAVTGTPQTGSIPGTVADSNYYVALRMNSSGKIVGVGTSGSGWVVGSSCWTSMKM